VYTMQAMEKRRRIMPINEAIAEVRDAHPECVRWYRLAALPRHLIGQRADGTYRAFSLDDVRADVDVYPMPDQLIPFAACP
jgi:hypothetical protein